MVLRGVNDDELGDLLAFGREIGAEVRFIEYMDVGGATRWCPGSVVCTWHHQHVAVPGRQPSGWLLLHAADVRRRPLSAAGDAAVVPPGLRLS